MTSRHFAYGTRLAAVALLAACHQDSALPTAPGDALFAKQPSTGFQMYVTGKGPDVTTNGGNRAVYVAGGGTDDAAGMKWLLAQGGTRTSGSGFGDVVVLRTSGSSGYNTYFAKLGANTVTTFVITSVAGANSATVSNAIGKAEVIFFAGGDQSTYVNLWTGTALQSAVNARLGQGAAVGGTSAGLNVLSEHIYSAQTVSTTSAMALANPYDPSITFARNLFNVPQLTNTLAEPHFVPRDRMGRLYTFLARLQADGKASAPRGLAVDEGAGVGITAAGTATVFGTGNGAYLVTTASRGASTLSAPLVYGAMQVLRVPAGGTFNANSWTAAGTPYSVSATTSGVVSTSGLLY
ncbi:cyanophycinase [Gemmatimonas phototrophica]|uniref:cyanophycinase n=1 Tax=Gemmatimonas phototrophica TaxID=1379270 RepID=UPI0006A71BF9|nr:cyanophycinase [Gemmatimonas phototrophica]